MINAILSSSLTRSECTSTLCRSPTRARLTLSRCASSPSTPSSTRGCLSSSAPPGCASFWGHCAKRETGTQSTGPRWLKIRKGRPISARTSQSPRSSHTWANPRRWYDKGFFTWNWKSNECTLRTQWMHVVFPDAGTSAQGFDQCSPPLPPQEFSRVRPF